MCVTIIIRDIDKDIPFIMGNNRDELINRNFIPPVQLCKKPYIVGGQDLVKGGTWLGINEAGIVINLLNKWKNESTFFGSDRYISRGKLVFELLKNNTIDKTLDYLKKINPKNYLPFFIIFLHKNKLFFVENDEKISIKEIKDNIFICGNINPFDKEWEKYKIGYNFLNQIKYKEFNNLLKKLKTLLKFHKGNRNIPSLDYAVNLGDFQTTSSTILFSKQNNLFYNFANGTPINTEYQDYSYLVDNIKI